ncbi:cytochrome P450 [Suillus lakei]|nr:cytochrome P450 [Suillus lakei]
MLQLPAMCLSDNTQLILGAAACLGVILAVIARAHLPKSESGLPLPPSPPTWRLWGHFLPPRNPFLTVAGWINEYGALVTIRSGAEKIIVISHHKICIMEKQGGLLADRPHLIAAGEMLNGGLAIALTPAGERWRRMRRALHTHFQPKAAEEYQPLQVSHAKNMVLDILEYSSNFQDHAATFAAVTIMKVAYGKTTPMSATDPELKYLPWYGRELKQQHERCKQLYTNELNRVKLQIQSAVDVGPSFGKYMLENADVHGLTVLEMAFLAGSLFAAGSDTTAAAICTMLMAAACFPDEQAKVQAELDSVIGRHRAPTFADEEALPRLHSFIFEALRWRPLENFCIPAGTTVFGHHWSISRDPDVFPEPNIFKPQRWIDDQGVLRDDLKFFVFGFGRRICPGQHLANRSVFISSLLVLWAFYLILDPTKPLDDMGFMSGVLENPRPCTIGFKMRVPETELKHMMQDYPDVT